MKGHKEHHHREHRSTGGVNEAEMDLREKPEARTNAKKIDDAAEERKRGGRTEHKKHGGEVHHHTCKCHKCEGGKVMRKKRGGEVHHEEHRVEGEHARRRADHKPRKSGGRANATENPFSSARHGTPAKGRNVEMEMD